MLIALAILLLALAAVIVRDWDFWFAAKGEPQAVAQLRKSKSVPETESVPSPAVREKRAEKAPPPSLAPAPTAATERAVLPPLQVEVIADNRHISVPAKSDAIHLDVESGASATGANSTTAAKSGPDAAVGPNNRVQMSSQTAQTVSVSVPPDYPLLARQMKVQGVVSLEALIARDGTIQQLRVLSGPEILATAAREAVKQWHFKPYLQNGQPVETQARITVNFTISTN
jgi:protein TonB